MIIPLCGLNIWHLSFKKTVQSAFMKIIAFGSHKSLEIEQADVTSLSKIGRDHF